MLNSPSLSHIDTLRLRLVLRPVGSRARKPRTKETRGALLARGRRWGAKGRRHRGTRTGRHTALPLGWVSRCTHVDTLATETSVAMAFCGRARPHARRVNAVNRNG